MVWVILIGTGVSLLFNYLTPPILFVSVVFNVSKIWKACVTRRDQIFFIVIIFFLFCWVCHWANQIINLNLYGI